MSTTQIYMICVILIMVFLMVLSTVWSRSGKDNDMDSKQKDSVSAKNKK